MIFSMCEQKNLRSASAYASSPLASSHPVAMTSGCCQHDNIRLSVISTLEIISIFHVCMVWIEKSLTRVTDRHHEACRVMPNSDPEWQIFLSTPYTHDRYFFLHTFWYTTFDFQSRTCVEITLFPLKGFYLSFKEVHATSDRRSILYVNV